MQHHWAGGRMPRALLLASLLFGFQAGAEAAVRFVKADAAGANTGASWTDAFTDLQAGITAAHSGDEIWVAAGSYKPTSGTDRTVTFAMKFNVAFYGGFAGTETQRDQRDFTAHVTILSGDIGAAGDNSDNTYHVVTGAFSGTLDGFTIANGNANESFDSGNGFGGGMINSLVSPKLSNCIFSANGGTAGGGMYNTGASPAMTNCSFLNNTAGADGGAGMVNENSSSPYMINCVFRNNAAIENGGGISNSGLSAPVLIGCEFTQNSGAVGGGIYTGSPTYLSNCTFTSNSAVLSGGGLACEGSPQETYVAYCTFTGNSAHGRGTGSGGGMFVSSTSATVIHSSFAKNSGFSFPGGGLCSAASALIAIDCTFAKNATANDGGGVYLNGGTARIDRCSFASNTAINGGALRNIASQYTTVNCTFSGNSAHSGGGIYSTGIAAGGQPLVVNCTFSGNTASIIGSGIYNANASPIIKNTVMWLNIPADGSDFITISGTPIFTHCDIFESGGSGAGWNASLGFDGGGNLDVDPQFVNAGLPAGVDGIPRTGDDGLRLADFSPLTNAGSGINAPLFDILGNSRFSFPEIGAYEHLARNAATEWERYL